MYFNSLLLFFLQFCFILRPAQELETFSVMAESYIMQW